jgi:hypothetical protein
VASKSFDVNKDGQMFVSAILGFLWMNEEELGFDPTIVEEDGKRYTEIWRNGQVERLCLEELMKRQRSAVGRATTCWKGCLSGGKPDHQPAIKDSWEYEERPEEGLLLKEATEAGVGMWRGTTTMRLCALGVPSTTSATTFGMDRTRLAGGMHFNNGGL